MNLPFHFAGIPVPLEQAVTADDGYVLFEAGRTPVHVVPVARFRTERVIPAPGVRVTT